MSYAGIALRLALACMLAAGCSRLLGVNDYRVGKPEGGASTDGSPPPACGGFLAPGSCASCSAKSCCNEAVLCRADRACATFGDCWGACAVDDSQCRARCYSSVTKTRAMGTYLACVLSSCSEDCLSPGDLLAPFGEGCELCAEGPTTGDPAKRACLDDAQCRELIACGVGLCPTWDEDPSCRISCASQHPDGVEPFRAWVAGSLGTCATCAWGTHWNCVNMTPPLGKSGETTEVRLKVLSGASGPFTVRACSRTRCSDAVNAVEGVAVLSVDQAISGTDVPHFELEGPGLPRPEIVVVGHPFIGPSFHVSVSVNDPVPGTEPTGPDLGTVEVQIGDCLGSFDPFGVATVAPSIAIDSGGEPLYSPFTSGTVRSHGTNAMFRDVPAGERSIEWTPPGSVTRSTPIPVHPGALTLVYLNYPVSEL
jgi:hypothetical protein